MRVIRARNVHTALPIALDVIDYNHVVEDTRNGKALVSPEPVTTVYARPTERVILHPWRDANPFFHLYESLWMLAGRRDVLPLTRYVQRMKSFSDDGEALNAAYGDRWFHRVGNQITEIAARLRADPATRRCVLQIWDAESDLWAYDPHHTTSYMGKDAACNLTATFQARDGKLNMVVFCRSNDIIWGAYGANAVHFSMLLEFMAAYSGLSVGKYTQVSVNWHAYKDVYDRIQTRRREFDTIGLDRDPYNYGIVTYPLVQTEPNSWLQECRAFITDDGSANSLRKWKDPFFAHVALPLVVAHDLYKQGEIDSAIQMAHTIKALDWRLACVSWLSRRKKKHG